MHIVASNLSRHFEQNEILYDLQHGFRERRSRETQLIQLVEELAHNTSQGRQTVATVSKNFKINLEGQNYVHFYVILSRNVKLFGIMASL